MKIHAWHSSSAGICSRLTKIDPSSTRLNCTSSSRVGALLSPTRDDIWQRLLNNFQGDFDNYNQVVEDRNRGMLPREGGGHENFHCTLVPISEHGRLAAFYFDGNPQRIFRFRYYELLTNEAENGLDNHGVMMRLYTLQPELERLLRDHAEEPLEWPHLFSTFNDGSSFDTKVDYLPKCEITWSLEMDPTQHSYLDANDDHDGLHAVMVHGEAIVDSTLIPGIKIRILDELSLYDDLFYINDRGLDPETGAFIYGNHRGVPYRLERVARIVDGKREIVNDDLKWTLGDAWRNEEEYKARINAVGGPSVQIRATPKVD